MIYTYVINKLCIVDNFLFRGHSLFLFVYAYISNQGMTYIVQAFRINVCRQCYNDYEQNDNTTVNKGLVVVTNSQYKKSSKHGILGTLEMG